MKRIFCCKKLVIALFSAAMVLMPLAASAQSGLQISPVSYDFIIEPGASKDAKLNIKNLDSSVLNYSLETELFSEVTEDGAPSFQGVTKPEGVTTLADWITFTEPKEGTIPASDQTDIHFTISVPVGAEPGGHYAAVFARQIKKDAQGKTQLGVASRVGLLLLVTVPGDIKKSAEITDHSFPSFLLKGPSDFMLKVRNSGSVHFESDVKVELKPIIGKSQIVELGKHIVLPDNTRVFKDQWKNKYPFGYYKIIATATDGDGKLLTIESSLWAIPINIVIPVVILVIILWALMSYMKSNFKLVKSKEKEEERPKE